MNYQNKKKSVFLFEDFISESERIAKNDFVTVFQESNVLTDEIEFRDNIQSLIVPNEQLETDLTWQWLSNICHLHPGLSKSADKGSSYFPWGNEFGIIPLIQQRFYNNIYPTEYRVLEEFILFHNLYEDPKSLNYYSVNLNSDQNLVIKYDEKTKSYSIKTHQLRQFISVKQCHLLIQYDCFRTTKTSLAEFDIDLGDEFEKITDNGHFLVNFKEYAPLSKNNDSRLLGKIQISGYRDYEHIDSFDLSSRRSDEDFHRFILAIGENGKEIRCSSNVSKNEASYYKIVSFNRCVLQRYYEFPHLYQVEDGIISKKGGWRLPIDNNNIDTVKVYLGDIGRLDKSEQSHWLAHNIVSYSGLSKVQYKRDILAIPFLEPEMPDLLFRQQYSQFYNLFLDKYGFSIFKPLHEQDRAYLNTIRIPLSDDLHEFEKIILNLSKVLCDSIDIKSINKYLDKNFTHKIDALEHFAKVELLEDDDFVSSLRTIQSIRSKSIAHNKDEKYDKLISNLGYLNYTLAQIAIQLLSITSYTFKKWNKHLKV
ncbi:hypothetical protein [Sphingobacterium spiritivorum]|uniref:hypothetical protein n=1 Tax=Sphingobacterium spiritivorum TaxID=258 RepID=UPI003DA2777C